MVLSEQRFRSIRKQLDALGYQQPMCLESGLLVDQLLSDLILLKENTEKHKRNAVSSSKKYETMKHSVQPLKELNEKLVNENKRLHGRIIEAEEKADGFIRELKSRILHLENAYSDMECKNNEYLCKIGQFQKDLSEREIQILDLKSIGVKEIKKTKHSEWKGNSCDKQKTQNSIKRYNISKPTVSSWPPKKGIDTKQQLPIENCDMKDMMELYKLQINTRDLEIRNLRKEFKKNSPVQLCTLCHTLLETNCSSGHCEEVECKLKDTQFKQHEAMFRALCLADRINELESKAKHKDQSEGILKAKSNYVDELDILKEQLKSCLLKIKDLEKSSWEMQKSNKALILEKDGIEIILSKLVEEKEKLKTKIIQLSSQVIMGKVHVSKECQTSFKIQENEGQVESVKCKDNSTETGKADNSIKSQQGKQHSVKIQVNLLPDSSIKDDSIEQMRAERNYYCNEYCKLKNRISCFVTQNKVLKQSYSDCPHAQLEQILAEINEKKDLLWTIPNTSNTNVCNFPEQKGDEVTNLKTQIQELESCLQNSEHMELERVKKALSQMKERKHEVEERLRRCENENLINSTRQKDLTSEILYLKTECDNYKQQLMCKENEKMSLTNEKNRLELIVDQNERTFRNTHDSKYILESELASALEKIKALKNEKIMLENKIETLEQEKSVNKEAIMQLDQEKDAILFKLDLKTEHNSQLERELKEQQSSVRKLNNSVTKLQETIKILDDLKKSNDEHSKSLIKEINSLNQQNFSLQRSKDGLIWESSRLQESLSCKTQELDSVRIDLDKSKREAEDLKKKLQTYVAEVQQVEELLQKKESERENLLEHFRSLTIEASVLETNNTSLESEAKTVKDVLKRSEDRVHTLEELVNEKNDLMTNMEGQFDSLTKKVFLMETKISELECQNMNYQFDLNATRELCSSLEKQKQDLITQLKKVEGSYLRSSTF